MGVQTPFRMLRIAPHAFPVQWSSSVEGSVQRDEAFFPVLEGDTIVFNLEEPMVRVAKMTHVLLDCCLP